jgi:hypothetical protein
MSRNMVLAASALGAIAMLALGLRSVQKALEGRRVGGASDDAPPFDEGFHFRRHWGSFGGESTGWNLSPPMTQLLTGALLVAGGAWLLLRMLDKLA